MTRQVERASYLSQDGHIGWDVVVYDRGLAYRSGAEGGQYRTRREARQALVELLTLDRYDDQAEPEAGVA